MTRMSDVKCCFCQRGPVHGVTVFRINAKGVPGIWACKKHRNQTDAPHDAELDNIVRVLEDKGQ